MGEMAELLVEGQRVAPRRLLRAGFEFRHFTLASALRDLFPITCAAQRCARRIAIAKSGSTVIARCVPTKSAPTKSSQSAAICRLRFHDSMRVAQPLAAYGLRREHLERRLYLRDEQGRIVSGFGAVLAIWARLPEYRRLASVFSWPPLRAVCETLYDHCVAPGSRIGRASDNQESGHERIYPPSPPSS